MRQGVLISTTEHLLSALLGMGVMLFALTIIVNVLARGFVERNARKKRGA